MFIITKTKKVIYLTSTILNLTMSSCLSDHQSNADSFQGVLDATSGTSVGSSRTTVSRDNILEVTTVYCRVGFKGNRVCLSGLKCKWQGHTKARSAMAQEPVGTYLTKKTKELMMEWDAPALEVPTLKIRGSNRETP
jgi:hypothetical protein